MARKRTLPPPPTVPGFMLGVAQLLDFQGVVLASTFRAILDRTDQDVLFGDWVSIGEDGRVALERVLEYHD